ncbi:MAG: hypothetical protein EBZ05_09635, partial [Verrucomicrobia bacterium]|nr:hypothetical protein [Verrucomicrobiota bacterium]
MLIGNQTTGTNLVQTTGKYRVLNLEAVNRISDPTNAGAKNISDKPYPISPKIPVVEILANSSGDQIQAAIDGAKDGTVIHLPAGTYLLGQPLTVKTGKMIKLQGDGLLNATTLVPDGDFGERGLIEVQPGGRLEARDLA